MAKEVYVRLQPSGTRLGNWMFQYASARSAHPDAEVVFLIERQDEWPAVARYREVFGDVRIVSSAPEGAIVRTDLYQDARWIDPVVAAAIYRCPEDRARRLEERYGALLADDALCSIHVRRGDYLSLPHRHPFVGERYLREAVSHVRTATGAGAFAVCSDDLDWCRRFFTPARFPGVAIHFIDGGGVLDDLFFMTKCRHHICSNSTFSWWGAFLGQASRPGVVVFPSMWFGPALRDEPWKGLYFDGSTVISNAPSPRQRLAARAMMAKTFCGEVLRALGLR